MASDNNEETWVDALPYYDIGYDAQAKEDADRLINAELQTFRPSKNYLRHLPNLSTTQWETDLTKEDYKRREENSVSTAGVEVRRYTTTAPPPYKKRDPAAWRDPTVRERIACCMAQTRLANLELDDEHVAQAWLAYNDLLSKTVHAAQRELESVRRSTAEINWNRKTEQERVGRQLDQLDEQWISLVSKNYQLQSECELMQAEVDRLKKLKQVNDAASGATS